MRYQELNELRGWKSPDATDDYRLIAFRGNYWILPREGQDIPEDVMKNILAYTGIQADPLPTDSYDFFELFEERPDVIIAVVMDNELHVSRHSMASQHPIVSTMIKKLNQELGLKGTNVAQHGDVDDITNYYNNYQLKGSLPDTLFHGTHADHLIQIAKTGLRAGQTESNWKDIGITHDSVIFGSVEMNDTVFHANRTAGTVENMNGDSWQPEPDMIFPVIIEFKLPNKDLIVPDYDVAAQFMGQTEHTDTLGYGNSRNYNSQHDTDISDNNPEERAWKSTGIYGYNGRIPPSHIIKIYSNFYDGPMTDEPSWWGTLPEFFAMWEEQRNEYFGYEDEDEWE